MYIQQKRIVDTLNNIYKSGTIFHAPPLSHRFHLRNKSILHNYLSSPKANKMNYGYKCFDKLAASLWNTLPPYLKTCTTLQNFKKSVKYFLLTSRLHSHFRSSVFFLSRFYLFYFHFCLIFVVFLLLSALPHYLSIFSYSLVF